MSKSIKMNLGLSENKTLKFNFLLPQNILEFLNASTYVLVGLYFLTIFSSYIFGISKYGELDVLLTSYIFLLVLAGVHFAKFFLGGEIYFSKVMYDIIILVLPPVVIASLILSNGSEIDTFGKYGTWAIASITILSAVMSSYLFALNFSNKLGEKFLQTVFDLGLIFGGLLYIFIDKFDLFDAEISTVYISYLITVLAPAYLIRLYNNRGKIIDRLSSIFLLLLSVYFYFDMVNVFRSELEARAYFSFYKAPAILVTLIYFVFLSVAGVHFFYTNKFNLLGYFKKVNTKINKLLVGNLKKDIPSILSEVWQIIIGVTIALFVFVSTFWFLINNYLSEFFADNIEDWKLLGGIEGLKSILIGQGLSGSNNHVVSMVSSYGVLPVFIFIFLVGYILFRQIKNLLASKNIFDNPRLFYLFSLSGLVIWALVFNFDVMFVLVFWYLISQLMIINREGELSFEKVKIIDYKSIQDPQYRTLVASFRVLLLLVICIGVVILINSLFDVLGGNLFYSTDIVN